MPGTDHEYYDCCFSLSHHTCQAFGVTNLVILGVMTFIFLYLLVNSKWFRSQRLLIACFFFNGVSLAFKVIYMLSVGYAGYSTMMTYMIFKSGGPADAVVALLAFLLYILQFTNQIDQADD